MKIEKHLSQLIEKFGSCYYFDDHGNCCWAIGRFIFSAHLNKKDLIVSIKSFGVYSVCSGTRASIISQIQSELRKIKLEVSEKINSLISKLD